MYYNRLTKEVIIDSFDIFLISFFITSKMVSHFKERRSEKAKMKRLKDDLIKKSKVVDTAQSTTYSDY